MSIKLKMTCPYGVAFVTKSGKMDSLACSYHSIWDEAEEGDILFERKLIEGRLYNLIVESEGFNWSHDEELGDVLCLEDWFDEFKTDQPATLLEAAE